MYLIDTNVLSESRKRGRANPGVVDFFKRADRTRARLCISVLTLGEIRRGVESIRRRGDHRQAEVLESWARGVLDQYAGSVLPFDADIAEVWGRLMAIHPRHALDKQIAATALVYDLAVVTRNVADFAGLGVEVINPFVEAGAH